MSLGVVVKGPEGIVLAADSRITLSAKGLGQEHAVNFDNATKLFALPDSPYHKYHAAVTYGEAVIGNRTPHGFLPEFELSLPEERLPVKEFADKLAKFFNERWQENVEQDNESRMTFIVGGYDEKKPYGMVLTFSVPDQLEPVEQNPGETDFGMTWGGQTKIASRIIGGYDPELPTLLKDHLKQPEQSKGIFKSLIPHIGLKVPWEVLPLQNCIDLATFMVNATNTAQALSIGLRGVGGPVDVAVITRTKGFVPIRQKELALKLQVKEGDA